jgi:hypothetical protein
MKTFIISIIFGAMFIAPSLRAQNECQVLVEQLKGSYEGGCKNGLAQGKGEAKGIDTYSGYFKKGYPNGDGRYAWSTGEIYEGEWKMGAREGLGKYTYQVNNRDTTIDGVWKENKYIGPKPVLPKITQKVNITSASFSRRGDGDQLSIYIMQGGLPNSVEDYMMIGSNGSEFSSGTMRGFQSLVFPFQCKINYDSWNPVHTVRYHCVLEFEITQPGQWELRIEN